VDCEGRTIRIGDAHREGKGFVVRADEKLTAFMELERAIHEFAVDLIRKRPDSLCGVELLLSTYDQPPLQASRLR
jgi:hypothetical protein